MIALAGQRLQHEDLGWRERRELESEVRWLVGMRAWYVGPNDWAHDKEHASDGDKLSDGVQQLLQTWRKRRVQKKDPCPICKGTGDYRTYLDPAREGGPRMRADRREEAAEVLLNVWRLAQLVPSPEAVDICNRVEDLLERSNLSHRDARLSDYRDGPETTGELGSDRP
ncbi:hypothetical protein [Nocardioides campestrisoli]|uniref:hypothetical protein n=1 Tax=Nocardioides campestrisoli TaxID=2736757 RepID=UPI00163D8072|nr:hypothetical protein [Nocardioides campestrisoli]